MAFEHYIQSGGRMLRCGYTTGTCAALAAQGAVQLLLSGQPPAEVSVMTPKGLEVCIPAPECRMEGASALCAIVKDGGDDADATDGALIVARAQRLAAPEIRIEGGTGVGRVTRPGLDQPVGNAAINRVPRQMIRQQVQSVCQSLGYTGGIAVTISVPGGEKLAQKTFNPHLGIVGGISILGTSGIVEPMSVQALIDTIAVELRQAAVSKTGRVILIPGNYGADFLRAQGLHQLGVPIVKCSNFIGEALDEAAVQGFQQVLLVGHVGKLAKLAGGIMNTHSRWADCRTELFCAHAAVCGAGQQICCDLMQAATTDACIAILEQAGLRQQVMHSMMQAIARHLEHRASGAFQIGAILFSNEYGLLGQTDMAEEILNTWR